jgi:hypothetical protein
VGFSSKEFAKQTYSEIPIKLSILTLEQKEKYIGKSNQAPNKNV